MEDVLAVYQRPYDPKRPAVCLDEKSKVLRAIHFNDEFFLDAAKVCDVGADGVLPPEFDTEFFVAQGAPEFLLCLCKLFA